MIGILVLLSHQHDVALRAAAAVAVWTAAFTCVVGILSQPLEQA
jgi:hypothetical protein